MQELLDAKEILMPKSNATGSDTNMQVNPTNKIGNQPKFQTNKKQLERTIIISSHTGKKTTLLKDC